ncbi:hypothetical protein RB7786 [Rhodopirellula baltica SH 1]|uniref:Uncharacterized protein n=1 Tax=Rhodopirellula baltica (strain DSM 10527 / NCIMB 13988 / SH1) TaxID=243090 RepID=Q7UN47_RHOBA|nr:hypothetical protein RB7786 [Rhodopirellula baltica SH 1]
MGSTSISSSDQLNDPGAQITAVMPIQNTTEFDHRLKHNIADLEARRVQRTRDNHAFRKTTQHIQSKREAKSSALPRQKCHSDRTPIHCSSLRCYQMIAIDRCFLSWSQVARAELRKLHVCLERSILSPIVLHFAAWFGHDSSSVDAVARRESVR